MNRSSAFSPATGFPTGGGFQRSVPGPRAFEAFSGRISSRPLLRLWFVLTFALGCAGLLELDAGGASRTSVILLLTVLTVAPVWAFARLSRSHPEWLCTPMPWLLAAYAAYYGFGPLALLFGSQETAIYIQSFWPVRTGDIWTVSVINLAGLVLILTAYLVCIAVFPPFRVKPEPGSATVGLEGALVIFLLIGLPVKYLLAVPYHLGVLGFTLPGSLSSLRNLVLLAILVLGVLSARKSKKWMPAFLLLAGTELFIGLLLMAKQEVLRVLIVAFVGRFLGHRRKSTLIALGVTLIATYIAIKPVTDVARQELYRRHGDYPQASLMERMDILSYGLEVTLRGEPAPTLRHQGWWSRLCYTPVQAFAIQSYDSGMPGDSYDQMIYSVIPRFLWPDKPIMTMQSRDLNERLVGKRTSSMSPGVIAEAYWNGGWGLLAFMALILGVSFFVLSALSFRIVRRGEWLLLPCAMLSIIMGFRIDGWFTSDYFGQGVIYVAYFGMFVVVSQVLNASGQPAYGALRRQRVSVS